MTDHRELLAIIDRLDSVTVALYGDLVLDRFILGTPKRISREAPVIILSHEGQKDIPGGGANALANLAALGARVLAVGAVGRDEPGEALLAALEAQGVETGHILRLDDYRTPTKVRLLGGGAFSLKHQVARYDIEDSLPAAGAWMDELQRSLTSAAEQATAVAISDYGYGCVQAELIESLRPAHSRSPWLCLDSRHQVGALSGVDAATPNLEELEDWAGRSLPTDELVARAAGDLREALGARFVLATRGNRGMSLVREDGSVLHIPVYGTDEVADVTGAGDTVLAVLTASLAAGADPTAAARLANYAGGIVVMKLGTATVSRSELRQAVLRDASEGGR